LSLEKISIKKTKNNNWKKHIVRNNQGKNPTLCIHDH